MHKIKNASVGMRSLAILSAIRVVLGMSLFGGDNTRGDAAVKNGGSLKPELLADESSAESAPSENNRSLLTSSKMPLAEEQNAASSESGDGKSLLAPPDKKECEPGENDLLCRN